MSKNKRRPTRKRYKPENEFDVGIPGSPRPMVGIWATLTPEQKARALAYDGPEIIYPYRENSGFSPEAKRP